MAYIYKITNNLNQKSYIGKTLKKIEDRWKEHLKDYKRRRYEKRPLYDAFKKYGIENFNVEEVEEILDESILEDREKYWIEYYKTYSNGYNATLGGDGKQFINSDLVITNYNQLKSCKEVAKLMGITAETVSDILNRKDVKMLTPSERQNKNKKPVKMFDLENNFIKLFESLNDAAKYLIENKLSNCKQTTAKQHISEVCRGKRKTFAKFLWKFNE